VLECVDLEIRYVYIDGRAMFSTKSAYRIAVPLPLHRVYDWSSPTLILGRRSIASKKLWVPLKNQHI
jgi:hypothetical protein